MRASTLGFENFFRSPESQRIAITAMHIRRFEAKSSFHARLPTIF